MTWSESAQPGAAPGWLARMPTASMAAVADSDHSNSTRVGSCSSAAACRSACSAARACPSQKPPDSVPPDDSPVDEARPVARIIAVSGFSQPRMGDHRTPTLRTALMPAVRRWGSKTATGPRVPPGSRSWRRCCRAGRGRDDGAGCVEDRVDHEVQALAGARWADDEDRVFDRCPDPAAVAPPEEVADIGGSGVAERGAEGARSA